MQNNSNFANLVSLVLLSVFLFSFAHCELDRLNALCENHTHHDYAQLVNVTILRTITTSNIKFFKVKIGELVFSESVNIQNIAFNKVNPNGLLWFSYPSIKTDLFIVNSSLII